MSKVNKILNMNNDTEETGLIINFENTHYYLNQNNIEEELLKFYNMREKLNEEKRLRKKYDFVKKAYNEYLILLKLVTNEDKKL